MDRFEKMGVAKYEKKRVFDMKIQETKHIKILEKIKHITIQEKSEIQKKYIEIGIIVEELATSIIKKRDNTL